jgi:Fe2+ transport system protein B
MAGGTLTFGLTANRPRSTHLDTVSGAGTVALAGNPNVGKTSVFNALTGLRQYTGNWPGKTVERAEGICTVGVRSYVVVDLPGTYSLSPRSSEEEVARDFICFGYPDVTVVVVDATALERNLNLALQVAEITPRLIVCLNLIDEARRKGMVVDAAALSGELGVPVVPTVARAMRGIEDLKNAIDQMARGEIVTHPKPIAYDPAIESEVGRILPEIAGIVGDRLPSRWVALRLLEGDDGTLEKIAAYLGADAVTPGSPRLMPV